MTTHTYVHNLFEETVNIFSGLRWYLKIFAVVLMCIIHCFVVGDLSIGINFVSNQETNMFFVRETFNLIDPNFNMFERSSHSDVKDQQKSSCCFVVSCCNRTKSFLASCIKNFNIDLLVSRQCYVLTYLLQRVVCVCVCGDSTQENDKRILPYRYP